MAETRRPQGSGQGSTKSHTGTAPRMRYGAGPPGPLCSLASSVISCCPSLYAREIRDHCLSAETVSRSWDIEPRCPSAGGCARAPCCLHTDPQYWPGGAPHRPAQEQARSFPLDEPHYNHRHRIRRLRRRASSPTPVAAPAPSGDGGSRNVRSLRDALYPRWVSISSRSVSWDACRHSLQTNGTEADTPRRLDRAAARPGQRERALLQRVLITLGLVYVPLL